MARKPKVYTADIDGVHEWIVAAPNQAEALAAFGVNQNLFQQGLAHQADDPKAVTAAQAHPGVPLRRLKGSGNAFKPADDGGSDAWAKAAQAAGVKSRPKAKAKRDRTALDKAQAELDAFEAQAEEMLRALDDEAEALSRRRDKALREQETRRETLRRTVDAEHRRFHGHG